ncbi:hypothetical protein FG060_08925 [Vibrio cholerae]|nr:hypothetical protein [Vibrio cholerae]
MVYSVFNPLVFYPWLQYRYLSQNGSAARSANGLYLKKTAEIERAIPYHTRLQLCNPLQHYP